MLFVSLLFVLLLLQSPAYTYKQQPPVAKGLPSLKELTEAQGVPSEPILFTSEDGYISWMLRLGNSTGEPILVQHGIFTGLDTWLTRGADEDLVYQLLKEGYDVYLGTVRGCFFNIGHVKYKRSDPRFWNFGFHEMGLYDIPAMIDLILKRTHKKSLSYVGHSLGTTVFLVMTSMRPEYNRKVRTAVLLSPVAFGVSVHEMMSPFVRIALANNNNILFFATRTGNYELMPRTENFIKTVERYCGTLPLQDYCLDLMGMLCGEHRTNLNKEKLYDMLRFGAAGSSVYVLYHFSQVYKTDEFKGLDYGPIENMKRYNSTQVPVYNLSLISTPVLLFWSHNDYLISQKAVMKLKSKLTNVIEKAADDVLYNHIDFIFGNTAKELVYKPVIRYLRSGQIS